MEFCSPRITIFYVLVAHAALLAGTLSRFYASKAAFAERSSVLAAGAAASRDAAFDALNDLDSSCGRARAWDDVLPPPRAHARDCTAPGGVLAAAAHGARHGRDAPFELANDCAIKWFSPEEACNLLERVGTLVVVGDSLQRHLVQALFAIMSDYTVGATALPLLASDECRALCACEGQFQDSEASCGCSCGKCPRPASAAFLGDDAAAPQTLACPSWNRRHVHFTFAVWSNQSNNPDSPWTFQPARWEAALAPVLSAAAVASTPLDPRITVLITPPLGHIGFGEKGWRAAKDDFLEPAWDFVSRSARRRLLCGGQSARFLDSIPPAYSWTVGEFEPYNERLRIACISDARAPGHLIGLFNTHPFTHNKTNVDGTHFSRHTNLVLAQLLLNTLEEDLALEEVEARGTI